MKFEVSNQNSDDQLNEQTQRSTKKSCSTCCTPWVKTRVEYAGAREEREDHQAALLPILLAVLASLPCDQFGMLAMSGLFRAFLMLQIAKHPNHSISAEIRICVVPLGRLVSPWMQFQESVCIRQKIGSALRVHLPRSPRCLRPWPQQTSLVKYVAPHPSVFNAATCSY